MSGNRGTALLMVFVVVMVGLQVWIMLRPVPVPPPVTLPPEEQKVGEAPDVEFATPANRLRNGVRYKPGEILGLPVTPERTEVAPLPPERLRDYLDPTRDQQQQPAEVIRRLGIRKGATVADIGAGSGYFTFRFADAVGAGGRVWATDISWSALNYLRQRLKNMPRKNVFLVLHDESDCLLPDRSVDLAFICDVHFFHYPTAPRGSRPMEDVERFYQSVRRVLRPGGRLAILEKSAAIEDPDPYRGRLSDAAIVAQLKQCGFTLVKSHAVLRNQYFLVFRPVR